MRHFRKLHKTYDQLARIVHFSRIERVFFYQIQSLTTLKKDFKHISAFTRFNSLSVYSLHNLKRFFHVY